MYVSYSYDFIIWGEELLLKLSLRLWSRTNRKIRLFLSICCRRTIAPTTRSLVHTHESLITLWSLSTATFKCCVSASLLWCCRKHQPLLDSTWLYVLCTCFKMTNFANGFSNWNSTLFLSFSWKRCRLTRQPYGRNILGPCCNFISETVKTVIILLFL